MTNEIVSLFLKNQFYQFLFGELNLLKLKIWPIWISNSGKNNIVQIGTTTSFSVQVFVYKKETTKICVKVNKKIFVSVNMFAFDRHFDGGSFSCLHFFFLIFAFHICWLCSYFSFVGSVRLLGGLNDNVERRRPYWE